MSSKDEDKRQSKLLNNDNIVNAKNTKTGTKQATNEKEVEMKIFYQNISKTLMISCLKNTLMVKIVTVL